MKLLLIINLFIWLLFAPLTSANTHTEYFIASYGNSATQSSIEENKTLITDSGIQNWHSASTPISHYFYLPSNSSFNLKLRAKVATGISKIRVDYHQQSQIITLKNQQFQDIDLGIFKPSKAGYQQLKLTGITKTATTFANIQGIVVTIDKQSAAPLYVKDDIYWGRRGPSVHLNYPISDTSKNYQWFYSELRVPKEYDHQGSYFMANGFAEGYFGMQVNSVTERRILFSVWSPFQTDDPAAIPVEMRIQQLAKGKDVYTGKFGNEGSGGQSYLVFPWQAEQRYRFLLKVNPADQVANHTDYSAYFYDPIAAKWLFIASFRRPTTSTYVARPHSFLENFIPDAGQYERKALYSNQWLRDTQGQWHALNKAIFSYDATATKQARMDYQGGTEDSGFYLRNTGFFTGPTKLHSEFERPISKPPVIDLSALPNN
ncbi:DUF3472 domain-containing protein [Pseudoalteromonas sp.]|uniref:DUF3472 domain-containing protein n=1 Tax=Pseudoalteromonas sp. TaxID=53249 RepID=UPI0030030A71